MSALPNPISIPVDDETARKIVQELAAEIDDLREDNATLAARLSRANQLLRAIRRLEPKPQRTEGFDDDPIVNLVIAYARTHTEIQKRIEIFFQSLPLEVRP